MSGVGAVGGAGAASLVGATPQISSNSTPPVSHSHNMPQDTLTISEEGLALLHGHKHKKKEDEDFLLLVYPKVQIHGGTHGITAQATPAGGVPGISAGAGASASGGGAAGGAAK